MRRRGFTIWELVVILALVTIAAVILYPVFFIRGDPKSPRTTCQSNLKQISLGIAMYVQDSDDKFPITDMNDVAISAEMTFGWADTIQLFKISQKTFWCPTQIENGVRNNQEKKPSDRDYTDYFFNRRLAGIESKKIKQEALTIMLGEGNDGTDAANARYSLSTLPAAWMNDKSSPLYRHLEGSNYAFADGHVKWMKAGINQSLAVQ